MSSVVPQLETPITTDIFYGWRFENRLNLSGAELRLCGELLVEADRMRLTRSDPLSSGFHVGGCGLTEHGDLAVGANWERGGGIGQAVDDAIHAEDSVITDAKRIGGSDTKLRVIAVTTDSPNPAASCGRCRGAFESHSDGDGIVVSGGTRGIASMWRLTELLPNPLREITREELSPEEAATFREAYLSRNYGFQPHTEKLVGKQGVALMLDTGEIIALPKTDCTAYYGPSSVGAALALAKGKGLIAIATIARKGFPLPIDRQYIYEAANVRKIDQTLPVIIYASDEGRLYRTTPADMLPHGFGPGDLGLDFSDFMTAIPRV